MTITIEKKNLTWLVFISFCLFLFGTVVHARDAIPVITQQETLDEYVKINWFVFGEDATQTADVMLISDSIEISLKDKVFAPDPSISPCFLFMTDTSLSMKGEIKKSVVPLLNLLVDQKKSHYRFAVGQFDSDLEMLTPFTTDSESLKQGINKLEAKGQRTELFRSSLNGLKKLGECNEYRRILVLISDGDAEDLPGAYSLTDVVQEARAQHISIITIGVKDTIKMQNLRRLSEDTAGWHWLYANDDSNDMPRRLVESMDNGGQLHINTNDLHFINGEFFIKLILADGNELKLPAQFSRTNVADELPNQSAIEIFLKKIENSLINYFPNVPINLWRVLVTVLSIFVLLLLTVTVLRKFKKPEEIPEQPPVDDPEPPIKTLAKIISNDTSFLINQDSISIGAVAGNDFIINDPTVGRFQATIDYKDGKFFLTDRGATNVSMINDEIIQHQQLIDGDVLKFGRWEGVFRI